MIIIKVREYYHLVEMLSSGMISTSISEEFALTTTIPTSSKRFQNLKELFENEEEIREELRQAITLYK